MSVRIIVDSTADLLPEVASRLTVVPLSVRFGDREYVQGVDITNAQFYEMLVESDALPTTSQATPYQFETAFREAVEAGADIIMLDNMTHDEMRDALAIINGRAEVEISGNVTKENIEKIKDLGVDYISSGALTHSAPILDVSLKNLRPIEQ